MQNKGNGRNYKKSKNINVNYRMDFLYIHSMVYFGFSQKKIHSMVYSIQKNPFYSLHYELFENKNPFIKTFDLFPNGIIGDLAIRFQLRVSKLDILTVFWIFFF